MRLLAAAAFVALASTPALAANPTIQKIEAKLFYSETATLSDNVAEGSGVNLWNTIIGEGDAGGAASDVLVIVTVGAEPGAFVDTPLYIEITGSDGKSVASRKIEGLLIGSNGLVSKAVLLDDSTCNALTVKAAIGKSEKSTAVPFACGE
jgi:hypothetical protein